jgi:hypothetical protein
VLEVGLCFRRIGYRRLSVGDPIGAGIVKSLGRPDKNITGLT